MSYLIITGFFFQSFLSTGILLLKQDAVLCILLFYSDLLINIQLKYQLQFLRQIIFNGKSPTLILIVFYPSNLTNFLSDAL